MDSPPRPPCNPSIGKSNEESLGCVEHWVMGCKMGVSSERKQLMLVKVPNFGCIMRYTVAGLYSSCCLKLDSLTWPTSAFSFWEPIKTENGGKKCLPVWNSCLRSKKADLEKWSPNCFYQVADPFAKEKQQTPIGKLFYLRHRYALMGEILIWHTLIDASSFVWAGHPHIGARNTSILRQYRITLGTHTNVFSAWFATPKQRWSSFAQYIRLWTEE